MDNKMASKNFSFLLLIVSFYFLGLVFANSEKKENVSQKFKGNILCLMPMPSASHHMWNRAVFSVLAEKGYNVTALSIEVDPNPTPNLHYIQLENVYQNLYSNLATPPLEFAAFPMYKSIKEIQNVFSLADRITLETEGFKTLLNYPDDFKFDLVLYDYTGIPGMLGFLEKFNYPPVVGLSAFMNPPNTYELVGNPIFPSLVPYYSTGYSTEMCFWKRSLNLFYYWHDYQNRQKLLRVSQEHAEKAFGKKLPSVGDLEKKIDLVLVNAHSSMDIPEPLLPNVVQVGGLQIKDAKPISKDLTKFIESSKKGAVLFSLGSTLSSLYIGEERIKMFISAFAKFPDYHFLWKFEEESFKLPKNIMTQKWFSQNDVLAHPKIKLFITHGGLLSTQESTWHGVPMLGVPFFGDQRANMRNSIEAGVAEKIDILTMTEEDLVNVLKRLLENPSYHRAMSSRSARFRDRVTPPLEEAVWWCEYVLRHRGAPHLRSVASTMNPFSLFMWDLLIVWGAALISIILTAAFVFKKLFCTKPNYVATNGDLRTKKEN